MKATCKISIEDVLVEDRGMLWNAIETVLDEDKNANNELPSAKTGVN